MSDSYNVSYKPEERVLVDNYECNVYLLNLTVKDKIDRIQEISNVIADMSWINKLGSGFKSAYREEAQVTINQLVSEIDSHVDNFNEKTFMRDLGELLVSITAREGLEVEYNHSIKNIPLAELVHAKIKGNPSFDFHTETPTNLVAFAEAKYTNKKYSSPYTKAIKQIIRFIEEKKDIRDGKFLPHFVNEHSWRNAETGIKAYTIAFSMNSDNYETIFENILESEEIKNLLEYSELYIVGVKI